jgi:hypothetical protein
MHGPARPNENIGRGLFVHECHRMAAPANCAVTPRGIKSADKRGHCGNDLA